MAPTSNVASYGQIRPPIDERLNGLNEVGGAWPADFTEDERDVLEDPLDMVLERSSFLTNLDLGRQIVAAAEQLRRRFADGDMVLPIAHAVSVVNRSLVRGAVVDLRLSLTSSLHRACCATTTRC